VFIVKHYIYIKIFFTCPNAYIERIMGQSEK